MVVGHFLKVSLKLIWNPSFVEVEEIATLIKSSRLLKPQYLYQYLFATFKLGDVVTFLLKNLFCHVGLIITVDFSKI